MLVVTPGIANLIRENKIFRITSAIQTGAQARHACCWTITCSTCGEGRHDHQGRRPGEVQQRRTTWPSAFAEAERGIFDDQPQSEGGENAA